MQNYKDLSGKVHELPSEDYANLLPPGCVKITPEEADIIANPPLTLDQITKQFSISIQTLLDQEAQAKGYDSILSACSYAYPGNSFQAESQSFVAWRSAVWAYCYQEMDKVKNGTRPVPTIEQIISELPARIVP